ncbi:MAG TPA: glycosyltransferase [Candidatus Polarisedimenticolia bacterium]|nr:glycosyltransferase [Candidatus Polarisedimenticolia bacterium]
MQILFVHPNFPAQLGPIASWLARTGRAECVFVSANARGERDGVRCIQARPRGGATPATHHCSRTFENAVWSAHAVFEACRADPRLRPDLIVGHSGFGTTAMLPELYPAPIVSLLEYYYHPHGADMDFRPEYPPREIDFLRARMRNAMILLDLEACAAGYSPTRWQKGLFPEAYRPRIEVIHDGVDMELWRRRPTHRRIGGEVIPESTRIVTYVSRGLEAMRGFDIFVRVASRVAASISDVIFVVVGEDRVFYGGDRRHTGGKSFRAHVLESERPDLSKFRFLGRVPPEELARLFSLSDLHIYLTVPFVLSWSLLDALACECTVLASGTPPVLEVVRDGENGLLAGFHDVEALAGRAGEVLRDPAAFARLGRRGRELVAADHATDVTFPRLWSLFERVAAR